MTLQSLDGRILSLALAGLAMTAACAENERTARGAPLTEQATPANSDLVDALDAPTYEDASAATSPEVLVENEGDDAAVADATPADGALEIDAAPVERDAGDAAEACPLWYADCDGDGYAAASASTVHSCDIPTSEAGCAGWTSRAPVEGAIDCEDKSPAHHPGADFGLVVTAKGGGLEALSCRPDGSYALNGSLRCVVTNNPDLNCDGRLEPLPKGAAFLISGGHYIADLTHQCGDAPDCGCSTTPLSCGVTYGVSAYLCPGTGFAGDTTLLCR